jgi:hypothetical protein
VVTPAAKREAVAHLMGVHGMSERLACKAVSSQRKTSMVLPQPLEERVPDLPLRRLGPILGLREELRFDPDALVSDALCAGCVFLTSGSRRLRSSAVETLSKLWLTLPA